MPSTFVFDYGPDPSWALKFFEAPLSYYTSHPSGRFRLDFGPVYYRGRLGPLYYRNKLGPVFYRGALRQRIKILVVGQDPSTDELLAQRNLVGASGQRVQKLLNKLGIDKSYVMFNTFLFGIRGQMDATMNAVAVEPTILNYRNSLFDKVKAINKLQAIISFGNGADLAVQNWPGRTSIPWFQLHHPSAPENIVLPNWNASLAGLHAAISPDSASLVDLTPYGTTFTAADVADIPKADLPFAIAGWHGTGGSTRSARDGDKKIQWLAP